MTPIAIVSPPRLSTNRPRDRHSEKASITIFSLTVSSTLALTPLVRTRGRSFFTDPSLFRTAIRLVRTVGTSRLCMWKTTWAPRMIGTAKSSITMIRAVAVLVKGGLALGKQKMLPIEIRMMSMSLSLITSCTVSPAVATASRLGSSLPFDDGACRCSTLATRTMSPTGKTTNESPTSTKPWMTRPRATIPFPSAKTSVTMNRSGLSICRLAGKKSLMASNNVGPLYHLDSSLLLLEALVLVVRALTFSPVKPEIGTNRIRFGLNCCLSKNSFTRVCISWYRSSFQPSTSSLLTATMICVTPKPLASMMCSLVWPPPVNPASNSPVTAAITRTATSAFAAPVIITGIKSWCPGASSTTMSCLGTRIVLVPISMVTPRARSDSFSSSSQLSWIACCFPLLLLLPPFPHCLAASRLEIWFVCTSICPMSVDFPASTCPRITMVSCDAIVWSASHFGMAFCCWEVGVVAVAAEDAVVLRPVLLVAAALPLPLLAAAGLPHPAGGFVIPGCGAGADTDGNTAEGFPHPGGAFVTPTFVATTGGGPPDGTFAAGFLLFLGGTTSWAVYVFVFGAAAAAFAFDRAACFCCSS
mmetsp:Transcript_9951/g.21364  ORF Transcript_9951/g.21364 Transcript_9951/m.21364 type:complete len:586 (-) Transcript_9951:50-1807(-)